MKPGFSALFMAVRGRPALAFGLAGGHLRRGRNRRVLLETIKLRPNNVLTKQANIRFCFANTKDRI
jgi:hypothetical protein